MALEMRGVCHRAFLSDFNESVATPTPKFRTPPEKLIS